jgi:ubiquinone/menaquinone biosynthesis C-methylase UbiE
MESKQREKWKEQTQELFEFESEYYASEREKSPSFQAQLKIVIGAFGGERGRVLDIGCAAGSEIPALRERGFEVVGVDYAPQMIRYAHHRFGSDPQVQFSRADIEYLPFADERFDHALCLGVLEYLPSYQASIDEIARVLRPGGLVVFSVPSRISPNHIVSSVVTEWIGPIWRAAKRLRHLGPVSGNVPKHQRNLCIPWQLRQMLESRGFTVETSAYSNFNFFLLQRFWPALNTSAASSLERFSKSSLLGWLGSQYLVSARKSR